MNLDTKVKVSVGCVNYLTNEVETLRKQNHEMGIENRIIHRFLNLVESINHKGSIVGYGEDKMWDAKREIAAAIEEAKKQESTASPVNI